MTSIHDVKVTLNDGTETTMADWAGHLLLIVNTASECGLTPQYEALQRLFEEYGERGLFVIGVPCNQFNEQEPGTDEEILEFVTENFGVTFPLLAKTDVNGDNEHPLFAILKEQIDNEGKGGVVSWNFEKFLVNPEGEVFARFKPPVDPEDDAIIELIEENLPV